MPRLLENECILIRWQKYIDELTHNIPQWINTGTSDLSGMRSVLDWLKYTLIMQRWCITCIFWYIYEPLGECVHQENTSDEWDIPRLYHVKGLHINFILCYRKYSGQLWKLGMIHLNSTDRWEGSVEYWRIYNGFPAFNFWLAVFSMTWYKTLDPMLSDSHKLEPRKENKRKNHTIDAR